MNIYHVYIEYRHDGDFSILMALYSVEQVLLLGGSLSEIARIESWNGDVIYQRKTVH